MSHEQLSGGTRRRQIPRLSVHGKRQPSRALFEPEDSPFVPVERVYSQDLYVIADAYGHVKIGVAEDVKTRLGALQTAHAKPLTLLHVEEGAGVFEISLHNLLDEYHVMGEWFAFGDRDALPLIMAGIARLRTEAAA